jgi:hypothetical protein
LFDIGYQIEKESKFGLENYVALKISSIGLSVIPPQRRKEKSSLKQLGKITPDKKLLSFFKL